MLLIPECGTQTCFFIIIILNNITFRSSLTGYIQHVCHLQNIKSHSDSLVVRNSGCFWTVRKFGSKHPHGNLQPSIQQVSGDPTLCSGLYPHLPRKWYTYLLSEKYSHMRNKNKYLKFKITKYFKV
jgi:hypothetical protein